MKIKVWHFSPVDGLKVLEPRLPSHPMYSDVCAVYLATSMDWCKSWAKAMEEEGYHQPPFYFYQGVAIVSELFKLVSEDGETFYLEPLSLSDIGVIDQVLSVKPIQVTQVYAS